MSGWPLQLLAVLVNGWLAGTALLLVAVAVDRPRLLPPRARCVGLLACVAGTAFLAFAGGAWWGERPGEGEGALAPAVELALEPATTGVWVALGWAAVAALLLLREGAAHRRLRRLRATWIPAGAAVRGALGWRGGVPLFSGAAGTPMAAGWLRPAVYLPERCFRELSPSGLEAVAAHERDHARWRDPATWAAARLARIVLWPVAPLWVLERRLHQAGEEAADAAATAGAGAGEREAYCRTLLEVAGWHAGRLSRDPVPSIARGPLEGRLRSVLRPGRSGWRGALVALALALAAYPALLFLPWVAPVRERGPGSANATGALDAEVLLERLRQEGVPVTREADGRIRIVVPEGPEAIRRVVEEAVVEERRRTGSDRGSSR